MGLICAAFVVRAQAPGLAAAAATLAAATAGASTPTIRTALTLNGALSNSGAGIADGRRILHVATPLASAAGARGRARAAPTIPADLGRTAKCSAATAYGGTSATRPVKVARAARITFLWYPRCPGLSASQGWCPAVFLNYG